MRTGGNRATAGAVSGLERSNRDMALLIEPMHNRNVAQVLWPNLAGYGGIGNDAPVIKASSIGGGQAGQGSDQGEAGSGEGGFHV